MEKQILINQLAIMEALILLSSAYPHIEKELKDRIAITKGVIKNHV